jgi:hypothetical protein
MDEWQTRQIREFLRRNPDAREETERKLLSISSPFGAPELCAHGKRLTEDCIHCLDLEQQAAEDGEGFPVGTLRDGFRGGKP